MENDEQLRTKLRFIISKVRELFSVEELRQLIQGAYFEEIRPITPFCPYPGIFVSQFSLSDQNEDWLIVTFWGDAKRERFERFVLSASDLGLEANQPKRRKCE